MDPGYHMSRVVLQPYHDNRPPRKVKLFDAMLSAIDRKKKKTLPKEKVDTLQATLGMVSTHSCRAQPSLTFAAPSSESFVPQQAPAPQVYNPRKLEPRGAAERADTTHIIDFLDGNRARPEDKVVSYEPKSFFEWDDDDEDSGSQVSDSNSLPQKLHKHKHKRVAAIGREKDSVNAGEAGQVMSKRNVGQQVPEGVLETLERFNGLLDGIEHIGPKNRTPPSHVDGFEGFGPGIGGRKTPVKRTSVLKIFDDPLWEREFGKLSSSILIPRLTDITSEVPDGSRGSPSNSNTSTRDFGKMRAFADQACKSINGHSAARSSNTSSQNATTVSKPSLKTSPASKDAPASVSSEVLLSPSGFRHVNWSQHGRGMSAMLAPECAPSAAAMPPIAQPEDHELKSEAVERSSLLKKFKSQFQMNAATPDCVDDGLQKNEKTMAGPPEKEAAYVPKLFSRLKPSPSTGDLRKNDTTDPFMDNAPQRKFGNTTEVVALASNAGKARRFNDHSGSPSRQDKRQKEACPSLSLPKLASVNSLQGNKESPKSPHTPSSASSGTTRSPGGMPKGPWEADWDNAVRYARKCIKEDEAREAKEAREREAREKKDEKRLAKLKVGKDLVRRQSQLGLTPKKPVQNMTEDEFELMASAATTPQKEGNIGGILGILFTKMLGTKEERDKQAKHIGQQLDNHTALQLLDKPGFKDVNEPTEEEKAHHDKALRLLNGDGYEGENLVNPFGSVDQSATASQCFGLGITSESRESQEERAQHNLAAAEMKYEDFAAMKRGQKAEEPANRQRGGRLKLNTTSVAEDDKERRSPASPLGTIEEHETEDPEGTGGRDASKYDYTCNDRSIRFNIAGNAAASAGTTTPYPSPASTNDTSGQAQNRQDHNSTSTASIQSNDSIAERHLDIDDDDKSIYSVDADAMPAPLNVKKFRQGNSTGLESIGSLVADDTAASHNLPMLKVARSSRHLQPADSNSFIPRRNSTFHERIQEASRLQQSNLGSHPALRGAAIDTNSATESPHSGQRNVQPSSASEHARIDSGVGMDSEQLVDEGYVTGSVQQQEFKSAQHLSTAETERSRRHSSPQSRKPTLVMNNDTDGRTVADIDIQALRTEVGLAPLRLPSGPDSPIHPNHPFTWNHEKIMCWGIHNPMNIQPQMPEIPHNYPFNLSRADSQYFCTTPTQAQFAEAQMCHNCGVFCCRFANLIVTSKIATSRDLAEEMVRLKAEQRVSMLRTYHPNGIEEYDTFLACSQCGHHVCPGCAKKCTESLCQAIVCAECTNDTEVCPVHNFL